MRIGIDLGGTNVRMGIVDGGQILKKIEEPCKADKPEKEIINHLKSMLRKIMNSNIRGIGIGVPSVVDVARGIVYNVINIPSWKEVHLKDILEEEFKVPVVINNDCNCFAFGERYYGEGTPFRNIVCITMGTGLGAGIIIDDKLYCGNNNGAGEIGILPYLDYDYEHYCSSHFFSKEYGTTAKAVSDRVSQGDVEAQRIMNEFGEHMGNLIKAVLYTYDPEAIIIGGGISRAFGLFSGKIYETLDSFPFPETVRRLKILLSKREDVSLLGAAALV